MAQKTLVSSSDGSTHTIPLPDNVSEANQTGANASTEDEVSKEAQKEADKKSNNTMTGVIQLVPHAGYKSKSVWYLDGLGGIFSGNYYFKQVHHKISINKGYSVSARVVKNEAGGDKKNESQSRKEVAGLSNVGSWV